MSETVQIRRKKKQTDKQDSFALSIILHIILFILLLIPIMTAMDKKPEPPKFAGIQVALGTPLAETKTSQKSAAASASQEKTKPSKAQPKASAQPAKAAPAKKKAPTKPKAKAEKIVSKIVTEKAPIVAVKEKELEKEISKVTEKAAAKKATKAAEAAKRKAAEDAKKAAEAEAKQKAAEAAAKKAAVEAAKKAAAKKAAKSKFNNIMQSSDAEAGEASKGNPLGHPDASVLEGISKGKGSAGDGLGNRSLLYAPEISDSTQKQGRVIINICVNGKGKVLSAEYTQRGSTTTDSHLINLAKESARKYRFSESKADEQCGEVIIDFKLK